MRIGINLLPFGKKIGGAGVYAKNIVQELLRLDTKNEYFLFVQEEGIKHIGLLPNNFNYVQLFSSGGFIKRIFVEQVLLPKKLSKLSIDILFTPSVAIPLFTQKRLFTTIHDIAFVRVPKKYPFLRRVYIRFITYLAIIKSEIVFSVSSFSAKEIESFYNLTSHRVRVTYNSVNPIFYKTFSSEELSAFKLKYELPNQFILYVGAIEPGKNVEVLIRAFFYIKSMGDTQTKLLLTSGISWENSYVDSLVNSSEYKDSVSFLPFIEENNLPSLYASAKCLVIPSKYEGFGIPVIEGMLSGIPVIASDIPVFKEIGADCITYFDQNNPLELADILQHTLQSVYSKEDKLKAQVRVKSFSWKESANTLLNCFENKNEY